MPDLWTFESALSARGFTHIAGIDEAGRGPLAGPVAAACVILHKERIPEGINDSKKLSPQKREKLFEQIMDSAVVSCALVDEKMIDAVNILEATKLAMRRAVEKMAQKPDYILIDGNFVIGCCENEQAVIKELGTPKQAAAELMRNLLDKKVDEREAMEKEEKRKEKKKTTGANIVWIAILALFAAPVGAPILISILIVLLCAALCAALLDMSVFLIAVVGVAAGIKMLLRGILAVTVSFGGFCFITGMGVFMLGISILCAVFGVYFAKWMGRLFVWCTRKVTKKGGSRS